MRANLNSSQWLNLKLSDLPRLVLIALLYAFVAKLVLSLALENNNVTIFWMPGGLALAVLILWGEQYGVAVFVGALLAGFLVGDSWVVSGMLALGNTLETIFAYRLLQRLGNFDSGLSKTDDFWFLTGVAAICACISALIGVGTLYGAGYLEPKALLISLLRWWEADTLGIILGTPLVLVWQTWPKHWFTRSNILKTIGFFSLAFFTGYLVFLEGFSEQLQVIAKGYLIFLFVVWGALFYGRHGTLLIIAVTTFQGLSGAVLGKGYFKEDFQQTGLQNSWFFIFALTITGMILAIIVEQRKQAHEALQVKERLLSESQRIAEIGSWLWYCASGKLIWSEQIFRILDINACADELNMENFLLIVHAEDRARFQKWLDDCQALRHPVGIEFRIVRPDGEIRTVYGQGDMVLTADGRDQYAMGTMQDITARKKVEHALVKSEQLIEAIFENTQEGICVIDTETQKFLYFNPAFEEMLGFSAEALSTMQVADIHASEDLPYIQSQIERVIQEGRCLIAEMPVKTKDGQILYIDNSAGLLKLDDRSLIIGVFRDNTERKYQAMQVKRLTQAYAALALTNREARRAQNEVDLFAEVCRISVSEGGVKMAWIGRSLNDDPAIQVVAAYGNHLEYLDNIRLSINSALPEGQGPTGTALREGRTFIVQDFVNDHATRLWRDHAKHTGNWQASAVFPILRAGEPYAVLTLYHAEKNAFDSLIVNLMNAMVDDIGFTLDIFDREHERQKVLKALRESETRFRTLSDLIPDQIWTAGPDGGLDYINNRLLEFFGCSAEEILETGWMTRLHADDFAKVMTRREQSLLTGEPFELDFRLLNAKGEYRWCVAKGLAARDEQGAIIKWYGINVDLHERKQAENALKESEARFRNLATIAPVVIYRTDIHGECIFVNDTWRELTGFSTESALGDGWMSRVSVEDRERVYQEWRTAFETGNEFIAEYRINTLVGGFKEVLGRAISTYNDKGQLLGFVGTLTDITERKRNEEKFRLASRVFDTTQESILITDACCNIVDVNHAFTLITGYGKDEVLGMNPRLLKSGYQDQVFYSTMWQSIAQSGHWSGEMLNRRKDGEVYPEWITISAITNNQGALTHYVGISSDISLLKKHEKQLEHLAHYDALTGIPNRILLLDRLHQSLAHHRRSKKLLAIAYLDLDGFKPINDVHGHAAGDRVLIEIAKRIQQNLRGGDTVARLGGDEFVMLLQDFEQLSDCHYTINRLLEAISEPIALENQFFSVTASIGVTLYPLDDEEPDILLRHADQAMYLSKKNGKNRFFLFDPDQDLRIKTHNEFRLRIEQGLLANEFEMFYQPKITLLNGEIEGFEALIRWRHPERGLLAPNEFLPFIENFELEIMLGEWVIDTVLGQVSAWNQHSCRLNVSINIAATHLQTDEFVEQLREKLRRYSGVSASQLQIEILETAALMDMRQVTERIKSCQALGISFALDDFGTGYSSLAYLRKLPADILKIDRSFVRDMLIDKDDLAIVQGVIALAQTFGRKTVAEGVETIEHLHALRRMGCDIGQGYGIARPMPAAEVVGWCEQFVCNAEVLGLKHYDAVDG